MALDLVGIAKGLVEVLDRYKVPQDARLSFLIGVPVGVLKAQGMSDADIRKFVEHTLVGALAGAKEDLAGGDPVKPQQQPAKAKPGIVKPGQGKIVKPGQGFR
jgi:hypothetical protein